MKKVPGWYNGFNFDIDWFTVPFGVIFRIHNEGYFAPGCRSYSARTLGMDGVE
jgi:hypothetical protein